MTVIPRRTLLASLSVAAALLALSVTFGAQTAQSASYKPCPLTGSDAQPAGGKPTYNTSLKAKGAACGLAVKVMRAFHACHAKSSLRCTRKVLATWTCKSRRLSLNPATTDFTASYTCSSRGRGVSGQFQQSF